MRLLLFPFAILYDLITSVRNRLYDRGIKPAATFEVPIVGVGNLSVGGTGKTPMVEYLIRLLGSNRKVATLSRGYGRKTKGFRLATNADNATTVGDEPLQFFRKYGDRVVVAVGEERALAIPLILQHDESVEAMILDDNFQHRKVKPAFQIVLTDYSRPFFDDYVLPAGNLRESRKGIIRADAIVVTKCPRDLNDDDILLIEREIRQYANKPVFFSRIRYGVPLPVKTNNNAITNRVVLISGIASAHSLEQYVRERYDLVKHYEFPDHHSYTRDELQQVANHAGVNGAVVLTTEKDAVKIDQPAFENIVRQVPFFYLPIETEFIKAGEEFDEMVLNAIKQSDA